MDALSTDLLATVCAWARRNDLLLIRVLYSGGREAVQVAVRSHSSCRRQDLGNYDAEWMRRRQPCEHVETISVEGAAALGRVFGGGCRHLHVTRYVVTEEATAILLEAVCAYIHELSFPPGFEELNILKLDIPDEMLLEICRGSPRLASLTLSYTPPPETCRALGEACPELAEVRFPSAQFQGGGGSPCACGTISQAEDFAWHFPKIKLLRFGVHDDAIDTLGTRYVPLAFDRIEESAERCAEADACDFGECVVELALVDCLLRTTLPSRVTWLYFHNAVVSESVLIKLVAACPNLERLILPATFSGGDGSPAFYNSLFRARPTLLELELGWVDEIDLKVILRSSLKSLDMSYQDAFPFRSTALVDIILASPCCETLEHITISRLCQTEVLRLITGMVNLTYCCYNSWNDGDERESEGPEYDKLSAQMEEIMERRGGSYDGG